MPSGVLLRHTRDRLDSLEKLAKPPQSNGSFPLTTEDYEALVHLVLEFPDSYRRSIDSELRRVFTERSRSVEQLRQIRSELVELADRFTALVRFVGNKPELRALAAQHAHVREQLAKLAETITSIEGERERLVNEWPVCSQEEMAKAAADNEQGRCPSVEEAFAAMKGISLDELRHRLEEHKARRKDYGWE